jgi:hypothetical protein
MQPLITIFALMVGGQLIASGKVSAEQAWLIPVGVIAYWFADKSGIWDKLFKGESPKADTSTIGTSPKVEGWGAPCDDYDYDNETVNTGFTPAGKTGGKTVDNILDGIFAEAKADGLPNDVAYVSSHIVSYLGAHGDELDDYTKEQLILAGINYAETAYTEVTGLTKLPTYATSRDYNKWWRDNSAKCSAPKGQAKAVFMTLRDLLARKEEL